MWESGLFDKIHINIRVAVEPNMNVTELWFKKDSGLIQDFLYYFALRQKSLTMDVEFYKILISKLQMQNHLKDLAEKGKPFYLDKKYYGLSQFEPVWTRKTLKLSVMLKLIEIMLKKIRLEKSDSFFFLPIWVSFGLKHMAI